MISYSEALEKILSATDVLSVIKKPLKELRQSVTAEAIIAPFDMPMFDNSAMDGYAVQAEFLKGACDNNPVTLLVQDMIQAGDTNVPELKNGHAIKIFTGAPIPKNATGVVMKEYCTENNGSVIITDELFDGENIRRQGEEFNTNDIVLSKGTVITPPVIGLLASLGYNEFSAYKKPSIGLLITGNELIQPGQPIESGQIYESNSAALTAALEDLGIEEVTPYFAKDDPKETKKEFESAINIHDVVITVGGISVGDFDFVKDVVESSGINTIFWRIAIKPGKPVYFGKQSDSHKLVFGLPGNPVSALVTFHQLVQPALKKMMGYPEDLYASDDTVTASVSKTLKKKPGRAEFVRGVVTPSKTGYTVMPTTGQQSHMLSGLSTANALIHFPENSDTLNTGESVEVNRLHWSR